MNTDLITVFFYSYILGSIPFGLIITKIFLNEDIRTIGSKNIGATNVLRTGKKSLAILTLLFDIFKGFFSIYITLIYFIDFIYFAGLICLIGHIFPIWLKFKGGKGVATYVGVILCLSFKFAVVFAIAWLTFLLIFRYSSLSSILSTFLVFLYSFTTGITDLNLYLFTIFVIIFYTHKENLIRLKNKKENKIKF